MWQFRREHPRTTHRSKSSRSRLLHLSDELLAEIFECVDNLVDAACFSLADGRLLSIGFPRLGELQRLEYAPWAGDRMICLGDYTYDHNYPDGLESYVKQLLKHDNENPRRGVSSEFASAVFSFNRSIKSQPDVHRLLRDRNLQSNDYAALNMLIPPEFESSSPWILCNLSKREYVRADAIAGIKDEVEAKQSTPFFRRRISLGQALLSRICWSSDRSTNLLYRGDLHAGPWAGDRFEVTTMDRMQGAESQWKDISEEVTTLLTRIWNEECGYDRW